MEGVVFVYIYTEGVTVYEDEGGGDIFPFAASGNKGDACRLQHVGATDWRPVQRLNQGDKREMENSAP